MKLLVLLIVLGLRQSGLGGEVAATVARMMRRWRDIWFDRGHREGWNGRITLALMLLPPVLLALVAVVVLDDVLHGLLLSLFGLFVMLIVLLDRERPDVLSREQEAWLAADEKSREIIAQADVQTLEAATQAELSRTRSSLLASQLHELFAPLFWFLLLGPVAALAYYFLRLAADDSQASPPAVEARQLLHYADWPVARVLALGFALAGDFVTTWQHWRQHALDMRMAATVLLDESAQAAQPVTLRMTPETLPGPLLVNGLAAVAALLQRVLVIWIVLLALHTIWP